MGEQREGAVTLENHLRSRVLQSASAFETVGATAREDKAANALEVSRSEKSPSESRHKLLLLGRRTSNSCEA